MNFNQDKTLFFLRKLSFLMSGFVLFGLFTKGTQGVLNISSVLLFFTTIYYLISSSCYSNVILAIKKFLISSKLFILFNIWCVFVIIFFSYDGFSGEAFSEYLKDWRYVSILFLFYTVFSEYSNEIRRYFLFATIITLSYICFFIPVQRLFGSSPQELYLQLRYGFAFYVVLLFPFAFTSVFFVTRWLYKIFFIVLSFSALLFLIYTGSRGGVLSLIIEVFIATYFLAKNKKQFFVYSISFILLLFMVLSVAYHSVDRAKIKIDQSMNVNGITSSRDKILETRFPIIVSNYNNFLFGIGYGSSSYNDYLTNNQAPKIAGGGFTNKGVYKYNNDEPFFITLIYNIGIIGLIIFLLSFIVNVKVLLTDLIYSKNRINISLISSMIGYFFVYCIFEYMFMDIYFLFTIVIFFFSKKSLSR